MKIGFFITARLKSTRLKRKILLDLNGKSVIDRVIERAKNINNIDGVVLCTSTNAQDSILYKNALSNQIEFYAGSEDDVLKRLLDAAKYFEYDAFVSITADNPLFSMQTSQLLVDLYKKNNFDFIFTKGLPMGCATNLIDVKSLEVVTFIKKEADTEIWGPFVNRSDFFNICELVVSNSPFKEEKRITCDYPEDYNLFKKIYSHFDSNYIPDIKETLQVLTDNPKYWKTNEMHVQTMLSSDKINKINNQFDSMKNEAIKFAESINKKLVPNKTIIPVEL